MEATSPASILVSCGSVAVRGSREYPSEPSVTIHPAAWIRSRKASASAKFFLDRASARSSASRRTSGGGSLTALCRVHRGFAKTLGHRLERAHGDRGLVGQEPAERPFRQCVDLHGSRRGDGRGPGAAVQEGHLAERVAGA